MARVITVARRLVRQGIQGRSTARRRVFEGARIDLHQSQEGSLLGGYPGLHWKNSIAEAARSYWIAGTEEISDLVGVYESDRMYQFEGG